MPHEIQLGNPCMFPHWLNNLYSSQQDGRVVPYLVKAFSLFDILNGFSIDGDQKLIVWLLLRREKCSLRRRRILEVTRYFQVLMLHRAIIEEHNIYALKFNNAYEYSYSNGWQIQHAASGNNIILLIDNDHWIFFNSWVIDYIYIQSFDHR